MTSRKIGKIETFLVPPRWLFVRVESDDGAFGWGEASLEGWAEAVAECLEHAVNRFPPALQAGFAPAEGAVRAFDSDKQPPRRHQEGLDLADLASCHA